MREDLDYIQLFRIRIVLEKQYAKLLQQNCTMWILNSNLIHQTKANLFNLLDYMYISASKMENEGWVLHVKLCFLKATTIMEINSETILQKSPLPRYNVDCHDLKHPIILLTNIVPGAEGHYL